MPKVSIIIPVYNGEKYINRCLESLKQQTLEDIEVICVNDGSTDNTETVLKDIAETDTRIKVITQTNSGPVTARNNGIELSKGEYIGFIDIDDFVSNDYFEKLYNTAIENDADIAATDNIKMYTDDVIGIKDCGISKNATVITSIKDKGKIIITTGITWNKIYRKTFLDKYNLKQYGTCPGDDNIYNATTLICANKIAVTHEPIYYWVQVLDSVTHKKKGKKDFNVVNNYEYIDNWIKTNQNLSEKEKLTWLYILNRRKSRDFNVFYRDMSDEYKEEFKKLIDEKLKIKNLIVSLTSYPARINRVHETIESLLKQTIKADKIILWLAEEQFPNKEKDLPQDLLNLIPQGLTIDWYHDIKSYKKLIPALKKYPNAVIVTADDDVIYDRNWLKNLYKSYIKNPDLIHAYRCHYILFKNYKIAPYNEWNWNIVNKTPSYNNLFTGVGGVLYPPNCLYKDVLNEDLFTQIAPNADDIWFWAMCVLNNKKIHCIATEKVKLKYVNDTQQTGLFQINVFENNNNKQIQNVIKYYPQILKYLKKKDVFYNNNFERLFSIKSQNQRKVITIFGIKLKIKSKKLEEQKKIADIENSVKTIKKKLKKQKLKLKEQKIIIEEQSVKIEEQSIRIEEQKKKIESYNSKLNEQITKTSSENKNYTNKQISSAKNKLQYMINKYCPNEKRELALIDWYYDVTGETLNLKNPQTFNEKIQWMKLYDSTPEKTRLADKYLVRDWVKEKIGEEYLIPLLGVWDKFDDINFDELPEKFVLKCNHGSAYNIIVTNKYELDFEKTRKKINDWMNENFAFKYGFELHYKDISRKIIAEQYIETPDNDLKDYKFLCFSGEPKYIWVDKDRYTQHKRNIYDLNWNLLDKKINTKYSNFSPCEKPYNLDKMLDFARILSKDFNFVRVDFYENKGKLYFGEMTFTTSSGTEKVYPDEFAYELGQMIKLPIDNVKEMIMS